MNAIDILHDGVDRIVRVATRTVADLPAEALAWRPEPEANSIAWLAWHLARQMDVQVADLDDGTQAWDDVDATAFGMAADDRGMGYGDGPDDVARVRPTDPQFLARYVTQAADRMRRYLDTLSEDDLDEIVDEAWDPPVTRGVRLVSIVGDGLQHVGQAAYLRGMWQRGAQG